MCRSLGWVYSPFFPFVAYLGLLPLFRGDFMESIGKELGQRCVDLKVTVSDMSTLLDISRPTLMSWFEGGTAPKHSHINKVHILLSLLERAAK